VAQTLGRGALWARSSQDPLFAHGISSIRVWAGRGATSAAGRGPVLMALLAAW